MAKLIELPTGEIAEFPDEMGDDEISSVLRKQFPPTGQPDTAQVPEEELDSAWDFSGERTLGGRVKESGKALGRDFLNLFLKGAQGSEALTEYVPGAKVGQFLGDMALDLTGKKDDYLKAKEEQKTYIPRAMDYLNQESILAGDEKYQDLFTTQLGGAFGSIAGFALTSLVSPAAGIALAGTAGVGTQEQKLQQAAESGEDISGFEELYGRTLGGAIGLLDTIPLTRILRFLPKNIPVPDKERIFTMVKDAIFTGAEEGAQEVASSVLQNIVEMGYNPNAELPSGESLFNDFAIGFVAGGGMQVASDVIRNNRMNAVSQIEYDREREVRMREDANNLQLKEKLIQGAQAREAAAFDPDAFLRESQAKQQEASSVPLPSPEEVKQFNAPSSAGAAVTPPGLAELYSYRIIGSLGQYFPTNTSFTVNQEGGNEAQPLFVVRDAAGTQYGQPLPDKRVASYLASNLNKEVQNNGVRATILDTLKTSPEGYKPEDMDSLFRYGFRTLNPDSNRVTFAALNEAAGTTTENGFVEDIPLEILAGGKEMSKGRYQISLPDGTARVLPGLTASQKLNLERLNKGLPASTTFDINEARSFLGGNIGKLSDPNVAGIEDGLQYGAVVQNGKPVVVSEAGEVLSKRKTTAVERAKAGVDESGKSFLGDYAEFNTLDEAKRYAGRLNQRKGASRVMPSEILEGKKDLLPEIQSMLENKNISSELNSPEIGQLVKAFTGAESVSDMTKADQKLFYNRLRALPKLNRQTKLPIFKQRQYTPEQFSRASAATNAAQTALNEQEVADAIGVPVSDPAVPVIQKELAKQNQAKEELNKRFVQEVIPIAEDVRAFFREFGLNPMEAGMNLGVRLKQDGVDVTEQNEGFYYPAMKEIFLSIDAIDTEGNMTQEQRVNALREVLSHEVIHALRATDLFTQKEWSLLESAVSRTQKPDTGMTYLQWARRPVIRGGYIDQSPLVQVEEAVADMARDFIGNRKLIGGKPRNLLERIIKFFQKARNLMDGYGFTTFEQVFQAVERGDIGRRQTGKIRTARSTEALLEKTFGTVPARYVKFGDTFSKGPTVVPQTVPESQAQATPAQTRILDFDPTALEGAEVRMSRKDANFAIVENDTRKVVGYAKTWEGAQRAKSNKNHVNGEIFEDKNDIAEVRDGKVNWDSYDKRRLTKQQIEAGTFQPYSTPKKPVEVPKPRNPLKNIPDFIDVDGVQRPSTNSDGDYIFKGNNEFSAEEGLRNFWRWFGDSKIVDEYGRPEILYHGSDADFETFIPSKSGGRGGGVYFAAGKGRAKDYGKYTYPAYLRVVNPADEETLNQYMERVGEDSVSEELAKDGYDGVDSWDVVVYQPNQIKSATKNTGAFSEKDDNIRFSRKDTGRRYSVKDIPATIDVDGVQRPTRNSEGRFIFEGSDKFTAEEGIRNFWRWFGDSDTVDEQGRPIVYYHGTKFPGQIDEFKSDTGMYWATPSPEFASTIAIGITPNENVPSVLPVYVRSTNAFKYGNLNDVRALIGQIEKRGYKAFIPGLSEDANRMIGAEEIKEIKKKIMGDYLTHEGLGRKRGKTDDDNWKLYEGIVNDIRALGFDGFHVWESGVDNIASFDKTSLKSALSNVGLYGPDDARIMYSRKDLQGEPKIPFEVAPSPDNKERTAAWRLVSQADKVKITKDIGPKAVREASKILGIDSAAFDPIILGQGLFEGHVNPNQILGIRQQFLSPDEVLEFASVLGRILEQKAMIAADGRMTGRETSVIRIQTNVSSPKVADRIYAALTSELGDLGGYTAYKKHIDVFNFTDIDSEALANRFIELLKTNTPDIKARVSHDTIQSAYLENETYGDYLRRKKSANQERLERGIESARSRIIGEFDSAIARAGQRSDGQRGVRRQAPQARGPSDALGRTGKARSLEEIKGPEWLPVPEFTGAESIPAFTQRKPKKDAVSAFGVHYSQFQGLMALDSAFAGSGSAGGERRRFGMGVYGGRVPPGDTARRLYFYVQSKMDVPQKEDVVAGNSVYRVRLDNLYDAETDPLGLAEEAGINADLFEEMVNDAGYDGAVYSSRPGINEPTVVLFGLSDKVPVRPYNEPLPEQPLATITEEQAAEAVAKAEEDTKRTGTGAVPLYGKNASQEALYIAQNPEQAATLTREDEVRYSRRNTPNYSPRAREIIDKNTPRPPDEPVGKNIINMMGFPETRDMWDGLRAGIFNRYARIERITRENEQLASHLADVGSYAAIEMADRSRYFTAMAASEGVPVYENGMFLVKDFFHKGKKIRGLIGLDEMLFSKEYGNMEELAQAYATAVRGERLNSEGKLTPVSPGELAELKKEVEKFINPETGKPIVLEWFDAWQDYNSYVVKFLRNTGAIDEAGAALWLKQADYIPFYREDANGNLVHPRIFGGLHTAGQFKAVGKSDKAINVDMRTAIFNNIDVAIAMGMKNVAQQRVIRDLEKLGLATMLKSGEQVGNRQSINFKVKGKQYTALIEDPLLYESLLPMSELDLGEFTEQVLSLPAETWRELITRNPDFGFANAFRDSVSAFMITGANIVPVLSSVKYFFAPLSEMLTGKRFLRDISEIEKMGIISGRGGYDLSKDAASVKKFYAKELNRRRSNLSWWKNPLIAAWDALGRFTERTEAATRLAVYNDVLKRSGSPAEAQYQAISVMNYARRGNNKILRLYSKVVPFTNANLQGKDKLYQAVTGRIGARYVTDSEGNVSRNASRALNRAVFAGRALLMVASTVLYYAMVHDDDEYLTASPEMRDNYYILPIMNGDIETGEPGLSLKLPIAFDVGSLFKVIPERIMALTMGEDSTRDFTQSMMRELKKQLFGGMPINIKPIYEAYITNYESFTSRPVVPTFMENLEPEQQKTFYTNKAIEKVAEMAGVSPMRLEHAITGYLPGVGVYLLQALDSTARYLDGPEAQKPAMQWFQLPGIKRFFTTANQPGLVNQFYDLKDNVDGIVQTINRLEKEGRYDELAVFYAKNGHIYEMRGELNSVERQIKQLRDERKIIEEMAIDQESKRVLIEEINMQINASLLTIPMLRQEAFGSPREE